MRWKILYCHIHISIWPLFRFLSAQQIGIRMSHSGIIQFENCRLLRNHELVHEDLWIHNGRIVNPSRLTTEQQSGTHSKFDCRGAIIAPGYIDLQINGGYGIDFSHDIKSIEEGVQKVAGEIIKHGTTAFFPTLVTSPPEVYRRILAHMPTTTSGAQVLGVHLEGPFISTAKKGAHQESFIRDLDSGMETLLDTYGNLDNVKIITLAPEKDPDGTVIRTLTKMGITVSLGHTSATLAQAENAVKHGVRMMTHLYNAMEPFNHREPGPVGMLASREIARDQAFFYGIIADGVHVHPIAMQFARLAHPAGLVLVTDAISALGLQDGIHNLGQLQIQVRGGKAFVAGTETLCGSIAHLDECVRVFHQATNCSIPYAIECATLHPATCLRIENRKGTLNFGADADFNLLNDDLQVLSTWRDGKCVHKCNASELPTSDTCKCQP